MKKQDLYMMGDKLGLNKNEIDNPSPSIAKGLDYIRSITP